MAARRMACLGDLHYCKRHTKEIGKIIKVHQNTIYYENKPISIVGDLIKCRRKIIKTLTGSKQCYINNKPIHRLLDLNTAKGYCMKVKPTTAIE